MQSFNFAFAIPNRITYQITQDVGLDGLEALMYFLIIISKGKEILQMTLQLRQIRILNGFRVLQYSYFHLFFKWQSKQNRMLT